MQKFKFFMERMRVTQGYGRKEDGSVDNSSYSHTGSYALDLGGSDTGKDWAYAPCDLVVRRIYGNYNAVWFETMEDVLCADGQARKLILLLIHINNEDRDALGIAVGKVFRQGEKFYREGTAGDVGAHIHCEVGLAPFAGTGWYNSKVCGRTVAEVWKINNQLKPHEVFIVGDDVQILDDGGYLWKTESNMDNGGADKTPGYGVDLSHNRSANIMAKINACGKAKFAVLRATIGSESPDRNLKQYIVDSGGIPLGFFSANYFNTIEDAVAEADFLVKTIQAYGFTPEYVDLPLFCDWEYFSYEWNKKQGIEITPEQLQEMTVAFCERIIERGYQAGIYVNKDFYENWYGEDFFKAYRRYHVWYARTGVDKPDRDCDIWQYACDEGTEYGADEPLDKNILFGEYVKHDFAVNCKECEALKAEMEQMKENHEAELNGCFETIDGYILDVHRLEEQKAQLKTENGVLKETIISLQEQLAEARKPKSLWEKILTIFLGE